MTINTKRLKTDAAYWDEVAPEGATHYNQNCPCPWLKQSPASYFISAGIWQEYSNIDNAIHGILEAIPRPTKPAAPEWDGEWPPTNTPCEVTTNDGHNWHETELLYSDNSVVLLRGYELYKKADPDVRCRALRTKEQRQREELVDLCIKSIHQNDSAHAAHIADAILSHYNLEPKK